MTSVILIIHIILAIAIIGLVLLQRGTGGGLGLGESGGMGNFASPRSAANILTKATQWCAILFFATSLGLAVIAGRGNSGGVVEQLQATTPSVPTEMAPAEPVVPAAPAEPEAPATP